MEATKAIDLNNTYWERLGGYFTDLKVDARWLLRKENDDKSYGSLRIVSHPDLRPGYLRAIFTYIVTTREKSIHEQIKTTEDYMIDIEELEAYSIDNDIVTENKIIEATNRELCDTFGVKIFK